MLHPGQASCSKPTAFWKFPFQPGPTVWRSIVTCLTAYATRLPYLCANRQDWEGCKNTEILWRLLLHC